MKASFKFIIAALAATTVLAGCVQEITPPNKDEISHARVDADFVITATIAGGGTKVSYAEVEGHTIQPGWELGDKIIGFDDKGATYGFEVTAVDGGKATLARITDNEYKGSAESNPADGTQMYMFYAPGTKPSAIKDRSLTVSIASQDKNAVPALMSAQAEVADNSLQLKFQNGTAIICIKNPTVVEANASYTGIAISGAGVMTDVEFSLDGNGILQTKYGKEGSVAKTVDFTSDENGQIKDSVFIATFPTESETTLSFTFNNQETYTSVQSKRIQAGYYYYSTPTTARKTYPADVADDVENGSVAMSSEHNLAWGDTVTITVKPDEGYEIVPGSLKVVGESGKEIELIEGNKFVMPKEPVTVTVAFMQAGGGASHTTEMDDGGLL